MRPRLPPLNNLKAFEAAARHESFTRAAEELCVTQGAVSQQVKALEEGLGIKLFNRERQRLVITEAGRDYLMGKQFTVADGYLFTMLMWATDRLGFDLSGMPNLMAYKARIAARPTVQEALKKEGLMKAA